MKKFKVEVEEDKELESLEESESEQLEDEISAQGDAKEAELDALRKDAVENYDKYLRAMADIDNLKKRFAKERSELLRYAGENIARDLLDVVDNLGRAASQDIAESGVAEFKKGVGLVLEEFVSILKRHGITTESSIGKEFDPNKHDALVSQPTSDADPGIILEELKQAYFFKDKLLRPAQVVVSAELEKSK